MTRTALPLLLLVACSAPDEVCPLPVTAAGVPGDANGDAVVDIADALLTHRYLFEGGAPPVCESAVMFQPDWRGVIFEGLDVQALLSYLYEGLAEPRPSPDCDEPLPTDEGVCGAVGWTWEAPRRVTGGETATAVLGIDNHALEAGIEGWSVGVTAEGCTLESARVEGTVAAPWTGDDQPGRVTEGFVMTRLDDGAATSAVVLNWLHHQALPPARDAYPVLTVQVSTQAPASGCATCTLRTTDGLPTPGLPLDTAMASSGRSYRPPQASVSFAVCAP